MVVKDHPPVAIAPQKTAAGTHNGPCVSAETGHEFDGFNLWKMVRT